MQRFKRLVAGVLKSPRLYHVAMRVISICIPVRSLNRDGSLLLAPPGAGNIGDAALVEAFLENTPGPVTVIMRAENDYDFSRDERFRGRVTKLVLPGLVYGRIPGNIRQFVTFVRHLDAGSLFAVCGADIMDGAYNYRASTNRSNLASIARRRGANSRILGFSWNERPNVSAKRALQRAGALGVDLVLRDPISYERARGDLIPSATAGADMVFCARSVDHESTQRLLHDLRAEGKKLALVNVSGLLARKVDLWDDYRNTIDELRLRGYFVVLLPHVIKPDSDDLAACVRVALSYEEGDRPTVIDAPLSPAEIRGLCASASRVVTGRMHLAIMALMSGLSPITLASQGKVEGLMRLFSSEYLCVQPLQGMAGNISAVLDQLDAKGTDNGAAEASLVAVRELAAKNFAPMS